MVGSGHTYKGIEVPLSCSFGRVFMRLSSHFLIFIFAARKRAAVTVPTSSPPTLPPSRLLMKRLFLSFSPSPYRCYGVPPVVTPSCPPTP